jgi:hypothetical protein
MKAKAMSEQRPERQRLLSWSFVGAARGQGRSLWRYPFASGGRPI